jgi:hypothetical protein
MRRSSIANSFAKALEFEESLGECNETIKGLDDETVKTADIRMVGCHDITKKQDFIPKLRDPRIGFSHPLIKTSILSLTDSLPSPAGLLFFQLKH